MTDSYSDGSNEEVEDPDFEISETKFSHADTDIKEQIAALTKNFSLTYAQVKSYNELSKPPLNSVSPAFI